MGEITSSGWESAFEAEACCWVGISKSRSSSSLAVILVHWRDDSSYAVKPLCVQSA